LQWNLPFITAHACSYKKDKIIHFCTGNIRSDRPGPGHKIQKTNNIFIIGEIGSLCRNDLFVRQITRHGKLVKSPLSPGGFTIQRKKERKPIAGIVPLIG